MAIIGWKVSRPIVLDGPEQVERFLAKDHPDGDDYRLATAKEAEWWRDHHEALNIHKADPGSVKIPGQPSMVPIFDQNEQAAMDKPRGEGNEREAVRSGPRPIGKPKRRPYDD